MPYFLPGARFFCRTRGVAGLGFGTEISLENAGLPLVSREWKNGSNSSYSCTPFLHSLLAKGKLDLNP